MQHATHRVAIYSGTREFINRMSRNKMYISDEQLHTMELCIYHGINAQLSVLKVIAYLRCVEAQKDKAGVEGSDGTTGCG